MDIFRCIESLDTDSLLSMQCAVEKQLHLAGQGKYSKSKIYCVRHVVHRVIVYIGSTIKTVSERWSQHKSFFKSQPNNKWASYVNNNGGHKNFFIELVELYPCSTLDDLLKREKHFIHLYKPIGNTAMLPKDLTRELFAPEFQQSRLQRIEAKKIKKQLALQYKSLKPLSAAEYQSVRKSNHENISTIQRAQLKKYIFDSSLTFQGSTEGLKSIIFDRIMKDRCAAKFFFNVFHEMNYVSFNVLDEKYSKRKEKRQANLNCIREICRFLGINNTTQVCVEIDTSYIKAHEKELVKALKKLSGNGLTTRNKDDSDLQGHVAVKNRLSSMLCHDWCGRKLVGLGKRRDVPLPDGKRGKEYLKYQLQGPDYIESLLQAVIRGEDYTGGTLFEEIVNVFGEIAI